MMAKTNGTAQFKTGESKSASVLFLAKFTTAKDSAAKGQSYSGLIKYAEKQGKTSEFNNVSVSDTLDADEGYGYANRPTATTEDHPLFNSDKLNLEPDDVKELRGQLDEAQANGNPIHEMAFSIRGDWLIENELYNPHTQEIDHDTLKHAQQGIVQGIFDKSFPLPLGETPDDVVWFGVIHQDTDHLNMHLWFAKKSEENRPEMIHEKIGEPKGYMNFKAKKQAEAKFRYELQNEGTRVARAKVYGRVDQIRQSIKEDGLKILDSDTKYLADLKEIYDVLPQHLRGRWKVGNVSDLMAQETGVMADANNKVGQLVDKLLKDELKDEYAAYQLETEKGDDLQRNIHGEQRQGQTSWSQQRDARLRKELANGIYREFNTSFKYESETFSDGQFKQFGKDYEWREEKKAEHNAQPKKGQYSNSPQPGIQHRTKPASIMSQGEVVPVRELRKISRNLIGNTKTDLQRTKEMLRDKEQKELDNTYGRESLANSDIKGPSI